MDSPRPCKRQRTLPSPPTVIHDPEGMAILDRATKVLSVEATALSHVTRLYQTDPHARQGLLSAIETIVKSQAEGGKVVICGVGKSGLVGRKTVATMKSLGIAASFLHAAEAAHGDLGDIGKNDVLLFVSNSGRTPELVNLLPHLAPNLSVLAMTSHLKASDCPLLKAHEGILLPAPLFESEEMSFGVNAPTTSTTIQIAIGDMLALTVAERVHTDGTSRVFKKNHPGGAIGAVTRASAEKIVEACQDAVTPLELPSPSISARSE